MKLKYINLWLLTSLSVCLLFSCTTTKTFTGRAESQITHSEIIDSVLKSSEDYHTYSAKMSINLKSDKTLSLKGFIKSTKDSVIWISLSPGLGFEVARVMMQPDSIFVLDRLRNNYYYGAYSAIKNMLHIDVSFKTLQSLLFNDLLVTDTVSFYNMSITDMDNSLKLISSKNEVFNNLYQEIIINSNWNVENIKINDKANNRNVEINYYDFQKIGSLSKPVSLKANYQNGDVSVDVDVEYSKIEIDVDNKYQFSVPAKYSKIKY